MGDGAQVAPDGDSSTAGAARRHAAAANRIARFLRARDAAPGRVEVLVLGPLRHAAILRKATGQDATGFALVLESSTLRHTLRHHGDPRNEARRGQAAVTEADFTLLPALLQEPETVRPGAATRRGAATAVFTKRIGGTAYTVVVELRPTARQIAFKTMFKRLVRKAGKEPRGTQMPAPAGTPQEFTAGPGLRARKHISSPPRPVQANSHRHTNRTDIRLRSHAHTPRASVPYRQTHTPA